MAQSLSKMYVHVIFSTKNKRALLVNSVREELHCYMATVLKEWESPALTIGSVEDHVHIICMLSKNHPIKKIVEEVKKSSSKWIKTKDAIDSSFQWQAGYGAFYVSQSKVDQVVNYINNQKDHHHKESFEEEYRRFLKAYNIEFDERYVWD